MYVTLAYLTGIIAAGAMSFAFYRMRDPFHPLVLIAPMLMVLYVVLPLDLWFEDSLSIYFTQKQLEFVQLVNCLGVLSICAGILWGGRGKPPDLREAIGLSRGPRRRVVRAAILMGFVGIVGFIVGIVNVGGLFEAYGNPYGGGWSDYGHVRDLIWLCISAIVLIFFARGKEKLKTPELLACIVFSLPFLIHGLLGARRGPTFIIFSLLFLGWSFRKGKRPRILPVLGLGLGMGILLLFLVSNRGSIYLGSELNFESSPERYLEAGAGNEVIYGAGTILNAQASGQYYWGRRYLVFLLVRPIPRHFWPNKYEDSGMPEIERNFGTGERELEWTLGWQGAVGAAPGIVADMWIEFWWFSLLALFGIGWTYGWGWRSSSEKGGIHTILFLLMMIFVLFLIFQTLGAMVFRFLISGIPAWIVWKWANSKTKTLPMHHLPSSANTQ